MLYALVPLDFDPKTQWPRVLWPAELRDRMAPPAGFGWLAYAVSEADAVTCVRPDAPESRRSNHYITVAAPDPSGLVAVFGRLKPELADMPPPAPETPGEPPPAPNLA